MWIIFFKFRCYFVFKIFPNIVFKIALHGDYFAINSEKVKTFSELGPKKSTEPGRHIDTPGHVW